MRQLSKKTQSIRSMLGRAISYFTRFVKLLYMGHVWVWMGTALLVTGCVQSPQGAVKELVEIKQPTFGGLTDKTYTSPNNFFTLRGECDMNAAWTEWTRDSVVWREVPCETPGTFKIRVNIIKFVDVYVRSARPGGFTPSAHARVYFVNPPTSPSFNLATSSNSDSDAGIGFQNMIDPTFTKATMMRRRYVIKQSLIDQIYQYDGE